MADRFSHRGSGELLFGQGRFAELKSRISLGKSLLLCGRSFQKTDWYRSIKADFKYSFTISGEPEPDLIDRITGEVKGKIDSVVAIGGGSVLDSGKAVGAMCCADGSVEDYLEGVGTLSPGGNTLPVIAIPTTAGTGSEATKNAVICRRGPSGYKKSLRHDNYIPPLVIIDPELYLNCPTPIMSSCGMDAFCQLLESYISTASNMYTDTLARQGMSLFLDYFPELILSEKKDPLFMGKIAFAAYLSGVTLANAGLGTVHGIAGPMGGLYTIPHGTACGNLLPEVLRQTTDRLYKEEKNSALEKLEKLGQLIIDKENLSEYNKPAYALCDQMDKWLNRFEIPRLSEFGIDEAGAEKIAALSENKNNPVHFSKVEIREIIIRSL